MGVALETFARSYPLDPLALCLTFGYGRSLDYAETVRAGRDRLGTHGKAERKGEEG